MGAYLNSLYTPLRNSNFLTDIYRSASGWQHFSKESPPYCDIQNALDQEIKNFNPKEIRFSHSSSDNLYGIPTNIKKVQALSTLKEQSSQILTKRAMAITLITVCCLAAAAFAALSVLFAPVMIPLIGFSAAAIASTALIGVSSWYFNKIEKNRLSNNQQITIQARQIAREILPYLLQIHVVNTVGNKIKNADFPNKKFPAYSELSNVNSDQKEMIENVSNFYLSRIKSEIASGKSPQMAIQHFHQDIDGVKTKTKKLRDDLERFFKFESALKSFQDDLSFEKKALACFNQELQLEVEHLRNRVHSYRDVSRVPGSTTSNQPFAVQPRFNQDFQIRDIVRSGYEKVRLLDLNQNSDLKATYALFSELSKSLEIVESLIETTSDTLSRDAVYSLLSQQQKIRLDTLVEQRKKLSAEYTQLQASAFQLNQQIAIYRTLINEAEELNRSLCRNPQLAEAIYNRTFSSFGANPPALPSSLTPIELSYQNLGNNILRTATLIPLGYLLSAPLYPFLSYAPVLTGLSTAAFALWNFSRSSTRENV